MTKVKVANVNELNEGQGKIVEVNGKDIALFNIKGKFYAIDNTCLHAGGPVGEGELNENVVTCPWHGWQYDVTTGKSVMPGSVKVNSYKVEIKGKEIFVEI